MRVLQAMFSHQGRLEEAGEQFLSVRQKRAPADVTSTTGADAAAAPETREIRLTERMRFFPIKGWTHGLLPTDPPKWQTEDGQKYGKQDEVQPPPGWTWISPWTVVPGGDKDNWTYAVDWPRDFHDKKAVMDYVRQRFFVRTAKNVSDRSGGSGSSFITPRMSYVRGQSDA